MPKPRSSSRASDQPMFCPKCAALVTKNTLNEHFVLVHGRKEPVSGQPELVHHSVALPDGDQRPSRSPKRPQGRQKKQRPGGSSAPALPDPVLDEEVTDVLEDGVVRCPDCSKKVKVELLAQHYRDSHKGSSGYKGKRPKSKKSAPGIDDLKPEVPGGAEPDGQAGVDGPDAWPQ